MDDSILPVHSPTYPPATTSMPQKNSETPSAKGIARLTVHIPSAFRQNAGKEARYSVGVSSPRWSTVEFRFYYVVALCVIPMMFWIPMSLSLRELGTPIAMTTECLALG